MLFDAGFVFNMLGFVLALAVCALFFAAALCTTRATSRASSMPIVYWPLSIQASPDRSPRHLGQHRRRLPGGRGRTQTVCAIASAKVQQALHDESHRKDDLVTYLAMTYAPRLPCVVGYLFRCCKRLLSCQLSNVHTLRAWRSTGRTGSMHSSKSSSISRVLTSTISCSRAAISDLGLLLAQVADEFYPIPQRAA